MTELLPAPKFQETYQIPGISGNSTEFLHLKKHPIKLLQEVPQEQEQEQELRSSAVAPYLLRTLGVIMITLQLLPQQGEFVPTLEGGAWVRQSSSLLARVTSGNSPGLSLVLSSLASLASITPELRPVWALLEERAGSSDTWGPMGGGGG